MSYKNRLARNVLNTTPKVVKQLLRFTPNRVLSASMEEAFNRAFKPSIDDGELDFFRGRCLEITITDIEFTFFLKMPENKIQTVFSALDSDVKFSGSGDNFLLLATQEIDPDTLFFQRKLKINGDTELGLEIKNFLANLELKEQLPPAVYAALKSTSSFIREHHPQ